MDYISVQTNYTMKNLLRCLVLIILVSSCREDLIIENTIIDDPIPTNTYIYEFGIFGLVVDEDDNAIEQASVTINGAVQVTDDNGYFEFSDQEASQNGLYASAKKAGYVDGGVLVVPNEDNDQQIRIVLLQDNSTSLIINSSGGSVSLQDGSEIVVPPNSFEIDGEINVNAQFIPNTKDNFSEVYPSSLVGLDSNDEIKYLNSIGAIVVKFTDAVGNELEVKDGVEVMLRLPIPEGVYQWPETISLWSLNEDTGYWIEESVAQKVGEFYEGTVNHFSWWSACEPDDLVDVCFSIKDADGNPVENIEVFLLSWYSGFFNNGFTDIEGGFCAKLPEGDETIIIVTNECLSSLHEESIVAMDGGSQIEIVIPNIPGEVRFEGDITKCDGSVVEDGYLSFDFGFDQVIVQIEDGSYSFDSYCTIDNRNTINGVAVDKSDFSASTFSIDLQDGKTSYTENISLCETLETFMVYSNTTSGKEVIFSNCEASKNPVETLIVGKDATNEAETVLLGVEGFNIGEFGTNLFGLSSETSLAETFKTNITAYQDIGGYVEGEFEGVTDKGDSIEGQFRALRIK